jgi:hypothetical protein
MLLTDLAEAARKSGLKVVELPGWKDNYSGGGFEPLGVLNHHTGSYDSLTDATSDLGYAKWMAFTGRPDLDPPLCNVSLSAECVVYICASGNANHAGQAKASGPMPAASDGNAVYIGIEAMNSGSQGWDSKGEDADGNEITQGEALARLNAALCVHYRKRFGKGFTADHCRAHRETSVTGKWDPGLLDMDPFRHRIETIIEEGDMPTAKEIADAVWNRDVQPLDGSANPIRAARMLAQIHNRAADTKALAKQLADAEPDTLGRKDVRQAVERALAKVLAQDPPSA